MAEIIVKNRITKIQEQWFITEPILFQILCIHRIVENKTIKCPVRSGKRLIEYNPDLISEISDISLEEVLKSEAIRILLKHPYERRPGGCCLEAIAIGSNIVIGDNYQFNHFNIETPSYFGLESGMPYEWYSRKIQESFPDGNEGASSYNDNIDNDNVNNIDNNLEYTEHDKYRDLSELWDEDELAAVDINSLIENATGWGSLSGNFEEIIKASTKAKIDWRNVLSGFKSSILSSKRRLTRMRPNRRTGFDQMGSTRYFCTKLLVAIDISGSISAESLSYFYGVIDSAFRYGFESIDVLQFDTEIKSVVKLKKVMREIKITGRGGTDFQETIYFANNNLYDGLVILTDGEAAVPIVPDYMHTKIVWVCQDQRSYDRNHEWMKKIGRVCIMELK